MRPINITLKNYLIKKIAVNKVTDKLISEKIIDTVITHQFESAHNATTDCNSVELSGFGKFVFNQKKANKQMAKYESQVAMYTKILEDKTLSRPLRRNNEMRLETTYANIKALKPKLNSNE